jgi:hypothetical protein
LGTGGRTAGVRSEKAGLVTLSVHKPWGACKHPIQVPRQASFAGGILLGAGMAAYLVFQSRACGQRTNVVQMSGDRQDAKEMGSGTLALAFVSV